MQHAVRDAPLTAVFVHGRCQPTRPRPPVGSQLAGALIQGVGRGPRSAPSRHAAFGAACHSHARPSARPASDHMSASRPHVDSSPARPVQSCARLLDDKAQAGPHWHGGSRMQGGRRMHGGTYAWRDQAWQDAYAWRETYAWSCVGCGLAVACDCVDLVWTMLIATAPGVLAQRDGRGSAGTVHVGGRGVHGRRNECRARAVEGVCGHTAHARATWGPVAAGPQALVCGKSAPHPM